MRAAAARGGVIWIGYRMPMVSGPRRMCCFDTTSESSFSGGMCRLEGGGGVSMSNGDQRDRNGSRIALEPATELLVLARLEGGSVSRVRTFASRALRGRRLAYALIAEPVDPEVETVRLDYRAQLAHGFERILREGIMRGVFPRLDPAVGAACIVGAFMEALVGPSLPPEVRACADRHLVEQITQFCLRASVGASEAKP